MRQKSLIIILCLSIPLLLLLNLALGSVSIPLSNVINVMLGRSTLNLGMEEVYTSIILHSRLPQALTAIACGAGLSAAGLLMQTVFRNPLAGPSVLGISSAASLGVACVVLLSGSIGIKVFGSFGMAGNMLLTFAAILGAMLAMMLMVFLSGRVTGRATLLIVGVMIGYIASAVIGVLKYFSSEEDVHAFVIWGLGSFARVSGGQVYVFCSLIAIIIPLSMLLIKSLNTMLLGDMYAESLGMNVRRTRTLVIGFAGVLTAIVTAYCGPIMFLGLAVPHICRGLFSTYDHKVLLPASVLCGASLALLCNLIGRLPGMDGALPINSVTALIGAPITLQILLKKHK